MCIRLSVCTSYNLQVTYMIHDSKNHPTYNHVKVSSVQNSGGVIGQEHLCSKGVRGGIKSAVLYYFGDGPTHALAWQAISAGLGKTFEANTIRGSC
jgi:hypothetical protein